MVLLTSITLITGEWEQRLPGLICCPWPRRPIALSIAGWGGEIGSELNG